MRTLPREEALKLWDQWWEEMTTEWFKVEVLQDYSGEDRSPSLAAWLKGDTQKAIELMPAYAKNWIARCQQSPALKRRFHITDTPYTSYLEWEIELYKRVTIPLAGEKVYLISSETVAHLTLPDGDVTIFDQQRVAQAHYDHTGKITAIDFYEQGKDDISYFLKIREELPRFAVNVPGVDLGFLLQQGAASVEVAQ